MKSSFMYRVSVTFDSMSRPTINTMMAMGKTDQNIQRQSRCSKMTPPVVGPSAGAAEMTMPTMPMVRPRFSNGTIFITVVINSGIMMAVPIAWTTRPVTSTKNVGARAASSVPAVKMIIAAT